MPGRGYFTWGIVQSRWRRQRFRDDSTVVKECKVLVNRDDGVGHSISLHRKLSGVIPFVGDIVVAECFKFHCHLDLEYIWISLHTFLYLRREPGVARRIWILPGVPLFGKNGHT